ncbi:hypothetical protein Acr_00g0025170 [Actinidia rufa]|uniref:Uncharacterized protein n=1 Tax=Actinidia rufa TaxID=165716 RepID=A0A7J0DDX4_9ERIC|nr:hypothetical protein Acr_00g0025170 [Actinidia rufa]
MMMMILCISSIKLTLKTGTVSTPRLSPGFQTLQSHPSIRFLLHSRLPRKYGIIWLSGILQLMAPMSTSWDLSFITFVSIQPVLATPVWAPLQPPSQSVRISSPKNMPSGSQKKYCSFCRRDTHSYEDCHSHSKSKRKGYHNRQTAAVADSSGPSLDSSSSSTLTTADVQTIVTQVLSRTNLHSSALSTTSADGSLMTTTHTDTISTPDLTIDHTYLDPRTEKTIGTGGKVGHLFELESLHAPHRSVVAASSSSSPISFGFWHSRLDISKTPPPSGLGRPLFTDPSLDIILLVTSPSSAGSPPSPSLPSRIIDVPDVSPPAALPSVPCPPVRSYSRFLSALRSTHYAVALRILRYVKGDPTDRRSTTGYCFFLGDSLISWRSKKQSVIARSSTEAEYRALADATSELLWLRWLIQDLGIDSPSVALHCDNHSAIQIAHNDVFHERTKHIEIDCHFIRHHLQQGVLHLVSVRSID